MVMEVPKKRCLPVSRLWQNLDGSLWQRQWLDLRHPPRCGLAKTGDPYLAPRWTPEFCRPICPTKESLLLLSQWIRLPRDDLHIRHATNSWLSPDKVKVALGPDCDTSPHPVREVPLDLSIPYIGMLLGPQKAARGQANDWVKQEESQAPEGSQTQTKVLPAPEEVLVTLRLQVDSCRPAEVSALIQILLGGTPVRCRNRQLWIHVQDSFEDVPLCVPCRKLLQLVWVTAPQMGCKVYLVTPDGNHQAGDLEALCRGGHFALSWALSI